MRTALRLAGLILIGLLMPLIAFCDDPPTATIEKSQNAESKDSYSIKLDFDTTGILRSQVKKKMFALKEADTGEAVAIDSVTVFGRNETNDDWRRGVNLYAKIVPSEAYVVTVSLVNKPVQTIKVAPAANTPKTGISKQVNFGTRYFHFDATPFVPDTAKAIGLKYNVSYDLAGKYTSAGLFNLQIQSKGEFDVGSASKDTNATPNSLTAGLEASWLFNVPAKVPLPNDTRSYVYPLGVRVSPVDFEADKKFSSVDYSGKVQVGGSIPWLDYPSLLWSKQLNLDLPFTPPTFFSGFTYLKNVRTDGSDQESKLGHERWDNEFYYDFPLFNVASGTFDLRFEWFWYVGLEKSFWKNYFESQFIYYLDAQRTHGFTLIYGQGAQPPDFNHVASWKLGYNIKF